ncbi:Asp23/Gls24 family envelope stress response protein [Streptomyces daliensis]|uniref:Asp23/Gls24 family envelope stress response protein n=1 Tax=Streptomyces daliensis TaxID=299421 RepID=A0A8T4IWK0_9ACTN|nr:Asp23/Gls24 family envelope stress response protein [Streptomyces daliensis]
MSDTASRERASAGASQEPGPGPGPGSGPGPGARRSHGDGAGRTERGRTVIADGVVEKIAGLAARDVTGVHAMGGGLARTFGAVRDRVPGGRSVTRGVKAEVGEVQTALDLEIVVEYGVSVQELARTVRGNVISAVERMTGLEVVEVNIAVSDVKLPDGDDDEDEGDSDEPEKPRLR